MATAPLLKSLASNITKSERWCVASYTKDSTQPSSSFFASGRGTNIGSPMKPRGAALHSCLSPDFKSIFSNACRGALPVSPCAAPMYKYCQSRPTSSVFILGNSQQRLSIICEHRFPLSRLTWKRHSCPGDIASKFTWRKSLFGSTSGSVS